MKQSLLVLIALCIAIPSFAQSIDATLDGIIKDAKSNLEKLTALDKSDKTLKASNEAQIFSTKAADKAEKEVKDATGPLQMDANRADEMRKQILAMGCPENGGVGPIALVQRCNPLIDQHQALHDSVLSRANALKKKMQTVNTLRENISKTTLSNAERQKKNNEERSKLLAQKLEIKTRAVMVGLKNKVAAEKVCTSMKVAADEACCHKVVFDGADPKLCDIEIMCQAFERGGLFGGRLLLCQTASR